MFGSLLPKNTDFFDYFDQHIALTIEGCKELQDLATNDGEMAVRIARIKEYEHRTDQVTHMCIDALHKTFITPIDRADIQRLIRRLDDIIDAVDAAAVRIGHYEIKVIRPEAKDVARMLVNASTEIAHALKLLRNVKNAPEIEAICVRVYQIENDADMMLRTALARLFREESNPIEVIKWKELFEILEKAVDRCEDVANVIQGVLIEAS